MIAYGNNDSHDDLAPRTMLRRKRKVKLRD